MFIISILNFLLNINSLLILPTGYIESGLAIIVVSYIFFDYEFIYFE